MYQVTNIYEPYDIDEDQDVWIGEISRIGYQNQIEIRAIDEYELHDLLMIVTQRLNAIISASGNTVDNNTCGPTSTQDDAYDRAMRGI